MSSKNAMMEEMEKRIIKEIDQISQASRHELEISKQTLIDMYERQIRFLKDEIDGLNSKIEFTDELLRQRELEN